MPRIWAPVGKSGPLIRWIRASSSSSRRGVGVLEVPQGAGGHLAQVVRRDVGGHADRDADRTVDQQVRESGRQHRRLERAAVVVVLEVDGLLVDVAHHFEGERGHLRLGVPGSGRAVVAGRAEVALAEGERVTQAPRLHEAHERVVDGGVTVRVELPHHVADDARALRERLVRAVAAVEHGVDHAAVHGLHAVTHVGQRAPDDDAHRVVEVGPLHFQLQVDLVDLAVLDQVLRRGCGLSGLDRVLARGVWGVIRCQGNARPSRSFG